MKTDKRTSNLFIAGGYCLVAVIILFNYLGQAVSRERTSAHPAPYVDPQIYQPSQGSENVLARQLDEEKRVNLEMREMLSRMQSAIGDRRIGAATDALPAIPETVSTLDIPDIHVDFTEKAEQKSTNPFIPGKNPFAPAIRNEDTTANTILDPQMIQALRSDPKLPFYISGANSGFGFYSNF
jgi:hypothetical protein